MSDNQQFNMTKDKADAYLEAQKSDTLGVSNLLTKEQLQEIKNKRDKWIQFEDADKLFAHIDTLEDERRKIAKVYDKITGGQFSDPSTSAVCIIDAVDKEVIKHCDSVRKQMQKRIDMLEAQLQGVEKIANAISDREAFDTPEIIAEKLHSILSETEQPVNAIAVDFSPIGETKIHKYGPTPDTARYVGETEQTQTADAPAQEDSKLK
jgi:hypothetical protein